MSSSTDSTIVDKTTADDHAELSDSWLRFELDDGTDQSKGAAADHQQQQKLLREKIAKMEVEFDNKMLQAQLKEEKLMAENGALVAKIAKMEQSNGETKAAAKVWEGDQFKQLQNVQKAILARIDELEKQLMNQQKDEKEKDASANDQINALSKQISELEKQLMKQQKDEKEKDASANDQFNALSKQISELEKHLMKQQKDEKDAAANDQFNALSKQISEQQMAKFDQQLNTAQQKMENFIVVVICRGSVDQLTHQQQNDQQLKKTALCVKMDQLEEKQMAEITSENLATPNCWDANACHKGLEIIDPKCTIVVYKATGFGNRSVFAKHSILNSASDIFYFEMKVVDSKRDSCTTIGLATKAMPLNEWIGCHKDSYGFRSDGIFLISASTKYGQPTFAAGDTVGCGVILATRQLIFTKNGQRLDTTNLFISASSHDSLFPCASVSDWHEKIEANFGPTFRFDVGTLR